MYYFSVKHENMEKENVVCILILLFLSGRGSRGHIGGLFGAKPGDSLLYLLFPGGLGEREEGREVNSRD